MTRFELAIEIPDDRAAVFAALVDPDHMRRWLYGTEDITEVFGPLTSAGTTFVQRVAKGIQRPGGVVASDAPRYWHMRLVGMGERADLAFHADEVGDGTRLTLIADIRNGPRLLGPIVDRLTWRIDRRLWRNALERIRDEVAADAITPVVGGVYVLEGGGRMRIGQVLDADDRHVHLELRPGWLASPPASQEEIRLQSRRFNGYLDLRPLEPTVRSSARLLQHGAESLLADGGFGLNHLPMTIREFRRAAPHLLGTTAVPSQFQARLAAWRERRGAAFGERPAPRVGALFSVALQAMGVDAIGFGVVKLLGQQLRGVHLRVYSNAFTERPTRVDDAALESLPADLQPGIERPPTTPVAIGHLPLRHASFTAWQPELIATALVEPDELLGYEEWKLAKGGFF